MVSTYHYLFLGAALFTVGVIGVLTRRNILVILMSIELMMNAVNINLIAFSDRLQQVTGQVFAIFVITVAGGSCGRPTRRQSGGRDTIKTLGKNQSGLR